ncbi:hypothetical protein CC80DRAFT_542478 [Byssothecium circinans]|uniref:Uncharacterized protein n=1 Tax=Byssothecium circinans TaxID=147558 RepID=A0A6A5UB94_9PLEO|nr:hypothetical protein CC80DRAFT_542478 [Byssothecium circinans]
MVPFPLPSLGGNGYKPVSWDALPVSSVVTAQDPFNRTASASVINANNNKSSNATQKAGFTRFFTIANPFNGSSKDGVKKVKATCDNGLGHRLATRDSGYASRSLSQELHPPPVTGEEVIPLYNLGKAAEDVNAVEEQGDGKCSRCVSYRVQQWVDAVATATESESPLADETSEPQSADDTEQQYIEEDAASGKPDHSTPKKILSPQPADNVTTANKRISKTPMPIQNPRTRPAGQSRVIVRELMRNYAYYAVYHHCPTAWETVDRVQYLIDVEKLNDGAARDALVFFGDKSVFFSQLGEAAYDWTARVAAAALVQRLAEDRVVQFHSDDADLVKLQLLPQNVNEIRNSGIWNLTVTVEEYKNGILERVPKLTPAPFSTMFSALPLLKDMPRLHALKELAHAMAYEVNKVHGGVWHDTWYPDPLTSFQDYYQAYKFTVNNPSKPLLTGLRQYARVWDFVETRVLERGAIVLDLLERFNAGEINDFSMISVIRGSYFPMTLQPGFDKRSHLSKDLYRQVLGSGISLKEIPGIVMLLPCYDSKFLHDTEKVRRVGEKVVNELQAFHTLEDQRQKAIEQAKKELKATIKANRIGSLARWEAALNAQDEVEACFEDRTQPSPELCRKALLVPESKLQCGMRKIIKLINKVRKKAPVESKPFDPFSFPPLDREYAESIAVPLHNNSFLAKTPSSLPYFECANQKTSELTRHSCYASTPFNPFLAPFYSIKVLNDNDGSWYFTVAVRPFPGAVGNFLNGPLFHSMTELAMVQTYQPKDRPTKPTNK